MRMTPRQTARVGGVLRQGDEDHRRIREEAYEDRRVSRLNESLLSGRDYAVVVSASVIPQVVSEASRAIDVITCRVFDKLSKTLVHFGGDVTSGGVLREDMERLIPEEMSSLKESVVSQVALAVSTYAEKVSRKIAHLRLPDGILKEDIARGIPDYALQEAAAEATECLKRHIRNHINQTATDPAKQRQMLSAANTVLVETEKEVKELLEVKLAKYMRSV